MNSLKSSLSPLAAVRLCTTLISLLLLLMTLELQKSLQNQPPPQASKAIVGGHGLLTL